MDKNKEWIKQMTLEEKASLMSGHDFWGSRGVPRLNIPQMFMADGPHGLRKQASEGDHLGLVEGVEATCFPTSATIANSWDIELGEEIGIALGKEAAYHQVNILLGPGLNTKRNPLCGRNFEYFSEDPYLSGKLAAAYIKGIQSHGGSACPKHFAANNQEYLRMTSDSVVDERTLHELYLTGFEIAVKEGKPHAIMSSYNKVNGIYANEHPYLLQDVLVDQWGFEGIVISDWGGANDPIEGVKAGSHLEMPTPGNDSIYQIVDAVKEGRLEEQVLDERVLEYLTVLDKTQLTQGVQVDYDAHHKLAQRAAEQSVVLLENDGVLPLNTLDTVAIIGDFAKMPRYQGAGSSMVNPYHLDNTLEQLSSHDLNVIGYAEGFERSGQYNQSLMDEAIGLAENASVALVYVGLNEVDEVEGHDRKHLRINQNQIQLLQSLHALDIKIVAVISGGSVIEMPWAKYCHAIIHGYLSGEAGANALLNVITGKVNPSGKIAETYPLSYDDTPSASYYPGKERTSEYREGIYVGYRYYDKRDKTVLYPFGYGLSYTTFAYSELAITTTGVTFTVTNTGNCNGSEIVQLYVGKEQTGVYRAVQELKGFHKVFLEAGESKTIHIAFDEYTFRYYSIANHSYQIEAGEYYIRIGSSSRDIRLTGTMTVEGIDVIQENKTALAKYYTGEVEKISRSEFRILYGKALPESQWDGTRPLTINDSLSQMVYAKNVLARCGIKVLIRLRDRSYRKGKPDLNLFFLSNMPFRAIAKMSNGMVSMEMTEQIVRMVNGHFFRGLGGLIQSFRHYRKRGKN